MILLDKLNTLQDYHLDHYKELPRKHNQLQYRNWQQGREYLCHLRLR